MKATLTLEFMLPEETSAYHAAANASGYIEVLRGIDEYLRASLKYKDLTVGYASALQDVRDELHRALSDAGILLNE